MITVKTMYYHTARFYESGELQRFITHASDFLERRKPLPVCKASNLREGENVFFTFSNELLQ